MIEIIDNNFLSGNIFLTRLKCYYKASQALQPIAMGSCAKKALLNKESHLMPFIAIVKWATVLFQKSIYLVVKPLWLIVHNKMFTVCHMDDCGR